MLGKLMGNICLCHVLKEFKNRLQPFSQAVGVEVNYARKK